MKRLTPQDKIKLLTANRRRGRKGAIRAAGGNRRAQRISSLIARHTAVLGHSNAGAEGRVPLNVPTVLSLRDNYDETVRLITELRSLALDQYLPVYLYFDFVERIEPAALIVLTAEIHRCRNLRKVGGTPMVSGTYPRDDAICAQLAKMGFFKLLNLRDHPDREGKRDSDADASDVLVIPFLTDREVTAERCAEFIDLLADVIGGLIPMDEKSQRYLQGAIVEAMKNAGEHAYKFKPPHQAFGHRWWLSGSVNRASKEVSILLFDQGAGIPATLAPGLMDRVRSLANLEGIIPRDSHMIEIATKTGETSTGQAGRGQGFYTMRKFVDDCDDGDLFVYSNAGHYMYARNGTSRGDEPLSLGGTLIQWRFRHSTPLVVSSL